MKGEKIYQVRAYEPDGLWVEVDPEDYNDSLNIMNGLKDLL